MTENYYYRSEMTENYCNSTKAQKITMNQTEKPPMHDLAFVQNDVELQYSRTLPTVRRDVSLLK